MDTDSALATGVTVSIAIIAVLCGVYNIYNQRQHRPMSDLHDDSVV